MLTSSEYSSRVALVTGGSQGIGAAAVQAFLDAGWNVATVALSGENVHRWRTQGVVTVEGDLTDAAVRSCILDATLTRFGRIDALVNNAGVGLYGTPSHTSPDLLRRLIEVNVLAPIELTRLAVSVMRQQGSGAVINIGSVAGYVSMPWAFGYCTSKFSLHAFNDSLRREVRSEGIRVVKICPGIVATAFREHVLGGIAPQQLGNLRPIVTPERIAEAILAAALSPHGPRTVYVPRIGRLFSALDQFCPALMDWYLGRICGKQLPRGGSPAKLDQSPVQSSGADA